MKITQLKNGDMIVAQGAKPIFVILGLVVFLLLAKGAFMWIFMAEQVQGNRLLAITLIALTILFFYRVFSLSSRFKFSSAEKNLKYSIQYPFFNKRGVVPVKSIEQAVLETDADGASRIVIKCDPNDIPLYATVEKSGEHDGILVKINEWLEKNKNT